MLDIFIQMSTFHSNVHLQPHSVALRRGEVGACGDLNVIEAIFFLFPALHVIFWLMTGGQVICRQGFLPPSLLRFFPPSLHLMCVVEQDGFDHA